MFRLNKNLLTKLFYSCNFKTNIFTPYSIIKPKYEYDQKEFWDARYSEDLNREIEEFNLKENNEIKTIEDDDDLDTFALRAEDWYLRFEEIFEDLEAIIYDTKSKILNVGCGLSELSFQMYNYGFSNIVNIDFSPVAISILKEEAEKRLLSNFECIEMDATEMTFPDEEFKYIIDKGTLDSIICNGQLDQYDYLLEIDRVLKKNGTFICISHTDRSDLFRVMNWRIALIKIPNKYIQDKEKKIIKEILDETKIEYQEYQEEVREYHKFKIRDELYDQKVFEPKNENNKKIQEIEEMENRIDELEDDLENMVISRKEFIKFRNEITYGDKDMESDSSDYVWDDDILNEKKFDNLDEDIKEIEDHGMTDLDIEDCNPNYDSKQKYLNNIRYNLYNELEDEKYDILNNNELIENPIENVEPLKIEEFNLLKQHLEETDDILISEYSFSKNPDEKNLIEEISHQNEKIATNEKIIEIQKEKKNTIIRHEEIESEKKSSDPEYGDSDEEFVEELNQEMEDYDQFKKDESICYRDEEADKQIDNFEFPSHFYFFRINKL